MAKKTIIVRRPDGAPGAFDKCRKLLAACALCSNPPDTSALIDQADAELDRLEADALALWAVRVLDAYGRLIEASPPQVHPRADGTFHVCVPFREGTHFEWRTLYGPTPDAARLAAADALAPELGDRCPRRPQ